MIEREEIPEELPVLVQQPAFIDFAGVGYPVFFCALCTVIPTNFAL